MHARAQTHKQIVTAHSQRTGRAVGFCNLTYITT